ncbi:hypothetical protein [Celeribacter halophilus]|uniref:Uncharacterized protein n=1 Tax=Celeribacter halophilus TaxID=576117 RepID=A0A1I3XC15_9RHOB|nr:hypothetical protein [Celeribacter halophilus]PZX03772.1 hypothetical protein LX82_03749 [Celeribacter halophilus]SFK16601.1 hypothetical protein SAMN04488138_1466 [Celeribacter halophilus]
MFVLAIIGYGVMAGLSVGVGIALGFELVMRLSGDGRSVILTWARVKQQKES